MFLDISPWYLYPLVGCWVTTQASELQLLRLSGKEGRLVKSHFLRDTTLGGLRHFVKILSIGQPAKRPPNLGWLNFFRSCLQVAVELIVLRC